MPWVNTSDLPGDELSKREEKELRDYERQTKKMPRFYADEDFPPQAVRIIREVGLNVLTAARRPGRGGTPTKTSLPKPRGRAGYC